MRLVTKLVLALLIIASLFSVTGVAFAQSSASFDLGCWSVMLGGGVRSSADYRVSDSTGYWAGGTSVSSTYSLRPGYIHDWAALSPASPPPPADGSPLNGNLLFLPLVSNYVRVVRTCPW